MSKKIFGSDGSWICPKCGAPAIAYQCSQCKFSIYAGFLPRFISSVIDGLILWPFSWVLIYLSRQSLLAYEWLIPFSFFFFRSYHIGLVALWGQTPGKMAAKIRVMKLDGSPATRVNALLRNSVETSLAFALYCIEIWVLWHIQPSAFQAEEPAERLRWVAQQEPSYARYLPWTSHAFVLSEFVVLWFNRKHRAIHDFIAGTVVLHDPRLPLLPWKRPQSPLE